MKEIKVKKKKKFFDSKTKIFYETDNADFLIMEFKDVIPETSKKSSVKGKGMVNNQISSFLFKYLENYHVPTHYVGDYSESAMVVRKLKMIPIEVVMHNVATGSLVKKFGVKEGKELEYPILEFYLKVEDKPDTLINEDHVLSFGHAKEEEIAQIKRYARKINAVLKSFFYRRNILLVDFRIEFGRHRDKILLGDEISPDTCRLWDIESDEKINKDTFRLDSKDPQTVYQQIRSRIFKETVA